jgi:putative ABC transport system permease protein
MLQNYFKIIGRNLWRSRSFAAINIFGLAVGMTCCLLLWLYIRSESSYDKHHTAASDLYLVSSEAFVAGGAEEYPMLSAPYAAGLQAEFPEIARVTRLLTHANEDKTLLQHREAGKSIQSFYETKGYHADPHFFELFTYSFKEGDAKTALQEPNSLVLSEAVALKIFGDAPALHKNIRIGGSTGGGEDFKVTGVYLDESGRSHIDASFFVPITAGWVGDWLRYQEHNFSSNNLFYTYVQLQPGADASRLEQKLPLFMEKYARKDLKAAGFDKRIFLIPVADLHLYEGLNTIVSATSSKSYLYMLASIALFTLVIACINFMNLATAGSAKRAKEVGVRKVLGAGRGVLIRQFLGESMIIALLAQVVALAFFSLALPAFNQLTGMNLGISALLEPEVMLAIGLLTLITGLLAGSYPAFYLSAFSPSKVLKGMFTNSMSAVSLRKGLVVFQFVVSVGLVAATLIIQQQMTYIRNKPLGFTKDQQLVIPLRSAEAQKAFTALRHEVSQHKLVKGAAGALYYPGISNPNSFSLYRPDQTVDAIQPVQPNWVDHYFLELMDFQLLKGRLFSPLFPADTNNRVVVNEAALRAFSIPLEDAVGYKLQYDTQGGTQSVEIVGVVKDFHFQDLHHAIQPYAFMLNRSTNFNYLIAHVEGDQVGEVLAFMEQKWQEAGPDEPFEFSFLDEDFQRNYSAEEQVSGIIGYFTLISIVISCLGLFGLAAFAAQQRRKEIGIRKVLGASVSGVVAMLSKDFIKLILIAISIATPLVWVAMSRWLQDFAYKIEIQWWIFGLAGAVALCIALGTISYWAIKAATANPVKNLRTE